MTTKDERGAPAAAITALRSQRMLLPTLVFVCSLVSLVSSLGAPLIPTIARQDHVSLSTSQWLLTATLLTGALATPVMGRLADGPRQRRVVLFALVLILAGCMIAALTDRFVVLVLARGLQGVGVGLVPAAMAIARRHMTFSKAGRTIATLSATSSIGVGLGYPLTGLTAQVFNVHAAFWLGTILATIAIALAIRFLPGKTDVPSRHFDTIGALTLGSVVVGIALVLSEGGTWGWTSAVSLGIAVGCAVVIAVWIHHELHMTDPLVDLRQVRNRLVLTADAGGFLISMALYLFIPVEIEFVQIPRSNGFGFGASLVVSGLVLLPLSITTYLATRIQPRIATRFGPRWVIPIGSGVFAIAAAFFGLEHGFLWEAFLSVGLAGFGLGFTYAAMPGFIVRAVPREETGSATGFYSVLRSTGLSIGSALAAAVLLTYTHRGHTYPTIVGFRVALLAAAGFCLLTGLISFVLPGRSLNRMPPLRPEDQKALDMLQSREGELAGTGLMLAEDPPLSGDPD